MAMSNKQLITHALNLWANYIETGDVITSATDCANIGKTVRVINDEQKEMVLRLRKLAMEALNKGVGPLEGK